jgi:predicted nucleic acid-binding protein
VILVDTNFLLRHTRTADPFYATVDAAVVALQARGEVLCVVPQVVYEFWAAATRPQSANGLGLSIPECQTRIARVKLLCHLLPDQPTLFVEWEGLVGAYACHGRVSYDARLVAAMRTHGLTRLLTFNGADFARFPGVTVLDPAAVAAPGPTP